LRTAGEDRGRTERCSASPSHKREEEGFTLIRGLVVILIMGIAAAIAIPFGWPAR
jgi:type II secretory pathway pseudopilin PulG